MSTYYQWAMGGTIDKDYPCLTAVYAFEYGHEPAASRSLYTHPNLGITFDVTSVCEKDSLDMSDFDRDMLLGAIGNVPEQQQQGSHHARIVITHGTDTMVETAQYIQKRIRSNAVIAFTGAAKPERFVDSVASFYETSWPKDGRMGGTGGPVRCRYCRFCFSPIPREP